MVKSVLGKLIQREFGKQESKLKYPDTWEVKTHG